MKIDFALIAVTLLCVFVYGLSIDATIKTDRWHAVKASKHGVFIDGEKVGK